MGWKLPGKHPLGQSKGPWGRTHVGGQNYSRQPKLQRQATIHRWGFVGEYLCVRKEGPKTLSPQTRTKRTVCWSRDGSSMVQFFLRNHCKLNGELVNSPHVQIRLLSVTKGSFGYFKCVYKSLTPENFILQNKNPKSLRNSLELYWSQNSRKGLDWRIEWRFFIKFKNYIRWGMVFDP